MANLLRIFAANLLPIFLIAGAGYLLGRNTTIDIRSFGRIVFYILGPALIFDLLTENTLPFSAVTRIVVLAVALVAMIGLLAWAIGWRINLDRTALAALALTAMFANTGNYGLPLLT
ncbi:MAG: AEC family transporter, partial [Anaerolineae bacterium]